MVLPSLEFVIDVVGLSPGRVIDVARSPLGLVIDVARSLTRVVRSLGRAIDVARSHWLATLLCWSACVDVGVRGEVCIR